MTAVSAAPPPTINSTLRIKRDALLLPSTSGTKVPSKGKALLAMTTFIMPGNLLKKAVGRV